MALFIQATITLIPGYTFVGIAPFSGRFIVNDNGVYTPTDIIFDTFQGTNIAYTQATLLTLPLPIGTYSAAAQFFYGYGITPPPDPLTPIYGYVTFKITGTIPDYIVGPEDLGYNSGTLLTDNFPLVIACLHGSSMIQMKEGTKRIDQIKIGDEVLSHNLKREHKYTKVKGISHCWLSFLGTDHDAIIFEPNSLGENEPSERLIIDPGHPICTQKEYNEKGYQALRPAGTYWEESTDNKIIAKKWTDVFVQDEPSVRYDLILEEPYHMYIANNIIVRSKGYKDHRYKDSV